MSSTRRLTATFLVVGALVFCLVNTSQAGIIVYSGLDSTPGGTVPAAGNAATARASFDAALSGVGTEDFEGIGPVGSTGPFDLTFPGTSGSITATLAGTNLDLRASSVSGTYATSGSQYLRAITSRASDSFTIDFSSPIAAFGFYATDVGDAGGGDLELTLTNGSTETLTIPSGAGDVGGYGNGNLLFFGFVSDSSEFTNIAFSNTANSGDFWGFDDMTVGELGQVVNPAVPEPASLAIFGTICLVAFRRRRSS